MASTFRTTGTYSNLTRLELERLRRAEAWASGKVLTIGDSGEGSENVVGPGMDVSVEPVAASSPYFLGSLNPVLPPARPGSGLSTLTHVFGMPSETVSWYGPTLVYDAYLSGTPLGIGSWQDLTPGLNFTLFVQPGDLLLVKALDGGGANDEIVAVVDTVAASYLICTPRSSDFTVDAQNYSYVIVRPSAVKLFAAPWSGASGKEQTFFMVSPGSAIHTLPAPTFIDLATEAVTNLVPPSFTGSLAVDRADAVYPSPAPFSILSKLGYRVVLYPDDGTGTGPDLTKPIASTHPSIDPSIPTNDQRISIDYRAGVVRLSCAPATGGDIKPTAGCVDPTTGRLNLYAVFWAVDTSLTAMTAAGLYSVRGDQYEPRPGAKLWFDLTALPEDQAWWIGASASQHGAFVQDFDAKPARIGVDTKTGSRRHLTFDNGLAEWRMHSNTAPSGVVHEDAYDPTIADRTALSVSDSSFEPTAPGLVTPTNMSVWGSQGMRDSAETINDMLMAAAYGYGVVHLRKGTHYTDTWIHIPPGVTLEGEGRQTRVELASNAQSAPVLRFGPNTPWGVYDFSYNMWTDVYTPSDILTGIKNRRIEGQDIVWNPNKKVWGVIIADVTSQATWFNEMRLDGSWVFPGNGIDLKDNARPFYTADMADAQTYHTPGHYPRMAYHPHLNRYGAAWLVRDNVTLNHAAIQTCMWETYVDDTLSIVDAQVIEGATDFYSAPSVAFNTEDPTDEAMRLVIVRRDPTQRLVLFHVTIGSSSSAASDTAQHTVVSSTDVTVLYNGDSIITWSQRAHPLLGSALANGVIDSSTPRRFSSGDLPNPTTAGVVKGSKLHHLNTVAGTAQGGQDFVVINVTATYVEIQREDSDDCLALPETFFWAISPPSKIMATRTDGINIPSTANFQTVVDSTSAPGYANPEMREPDFVRISKGADGCLVAFQAFNTTAFLARLTLHNYDNNIDPAFYDGNAACKSTAGPHREHVSTCSLLLSWDAINEMPGKAALDTGGTQFWPQHYTIGPAKSLGASDPLSGHANSLFLNMTDATPHVPFGGIRGPHLEVSARHVMHQWTLTKPTSLIPDITWTGQDWAIVSPTLARMESDTGTIRIIGGVHYLVDPTFCFGSDSSNPVDNNWLPSTYPGGVHFPATGQSVGGSVVSEHCIVLDDTTAFIDGQKVSWMSFGGTSLSSPSNRDSGLKIMGFRVASDGTLIQGSSRLLDYMPPAWSSDSNYARLGGKMETVSRRALFTQLTPNQSTGGANAPMTFGTLYQFSDGTERGGWDSDYQTSRISGNIGFQGVCAGVPVSPGVISPNECPMVAFAWGETFYAMAMRQTSGDDSAWLNRTLVLRQSFGPYNAEVRDLTVAGKTRQTSNWTTTDPANIQHASRRHVFTRWGLPNSPSAGFATDGYRNCFVYPSQTGQPSNVTWPAQSVVDYLAVANSVSPLRWTATYTDAIGDGALVFYGPLAKLEKGYFGDGYVYLSSPANDCQIRDDLAYNPDTTGYYPSSPVVLWVGDQFMAFWTEEGRNTSSALAGSYVCMAAFPAGPGTFTMDPSVGLQLNFLTNQTQAATVKVSCGLGVISSGTTTDVHSNQVAVCDAAFSGRTFGVVWTAGLHKDSVDANLAAGTALGIAIFSDGTPNGGGMSFLLATGEFLGVRQPKIVWDGHAYLVTWSTDSHMLQCVSIPEQGPASPTQVKRLSSNQLFLDSRYQTFGNLDADGNIVIGRAGAQGNACQPGDIVQIDKVVRVVQLQQTRTDGATSGTQFTASLGGLVTRRLFQTGGAFNFTSNTFADSLQTFDTAGVAIGMELVIRAPSFYAGRWVITNVAPTTLTIQGSFPGTGAVAGVEYYIDMTAHPGDHLIITAGANAGRYIIDAVDSDTVLHISKSFPTNAGTQSFYIEQRIDDFCQSGPHVVRAYDPLTSTVGLEMNSSPWQAGAEVVGSLLSGGLGQRESLPQYLGADADFLPVAAPRTDSTLMALGSGVAKVLSVVYMPEHEEYAVLYMQTGTGNLMAGRVTRNKQRPFPAIQVGVISHHASLAWNGKTLLLVYVDFAYEIRYVLLGATLNTIETGYIARNTTNTADPKDCPIGTALGQQPGPLYASPVVPADMGWVNLAYAPAGTMQARPKKVEAKWNDKLGRWVVSASYIWGMEGECSPDAVTKTPHANNPPVWPLVYYNPGDGWYQPCEGGTLGGTYVGRILTGKFYVSLIQPGMRLLVKGTDGFNVMLTVMGHNAAVADADGEMIYTTLTVDVDASELTPAEVALVTDGSTVDRLYATVREDVFLWTLKQGEPAVQVQDADGCLMHNVTIGESLVDISERYTATAQPIWRSAGELVGKASAGGTGWEGTVLKRQYTRSLLAPREPLRLDNCLSRSPARYGRDTSPGNKLRRP